MGVGECLFFISVADTRDEFELHFVAPVERVDRVAGWAPDAGAGEDADFAFYYDWELNCVVEVGAGDGRRREVHVSRGREAWLDLLYVIGLMKSEGVYPEGEGFRIWVEDGDLYVALGEDVLRVFGDWSFGVTDHILVRGRMLRLRFYYSDCMECEIVNEASMLIYKSIDGGAWMSLLDVFEAADRIKHRHPRENRDDLGG